MERPFIIYTLRRTGGTALTAFMSEISGFPTVQHEPFNLERKWGGITRQVRSGLAGADLRRRISEAMERSPNLKHCVEVVPMAITRELIELCHSMGYAQFVLQRRSEKDRLMSLHLAMATGAWGGDEAREIYPKLRSGELQARTLDVDKMAGRARNGFASMGETMMALRAQGIDFSWLVFEEIFGGSASAEAAGMSIARRMGLDIVRGDRRLAAFSQGSGQGSAEAMELVPQAGQFKAELDRLFGGSVSGGR